MDNIKAIIFDMDGVLVHSEPVMLESAIAALRELGANPIEEDFLPYIGTGEDSFIGNVAKKYGIEYHVGIKNRTYDIYDELVFDKIETYNNTSEAINKLINKGYAIALASAADKRKVLVNLKAANIDTNLFSVILSAEDVVNKKPAPDVYNLAAKKLNIKNENCLVIEDAIKGIKAAHDANMKCVGVTTTFTKEELVEGNADYVVNIMSEIVDML